MLNIDIAGRLFVDIKTMIVQLASTGILLYAFYRLLWNPVLALLEKRAEFEQDVLNQAKQRFEEAQQNKNEAISQLQQAASEAQKIMERGQSEGRRIKDTLVAEGRKEAEMKLVSVRRQIENEKLQMQQSIHREIVDVALLATSKLMENKVTEQSDRQAIEQFVKDAVN